MTHGHGAEPAPQEIHRSDGEAQLGDGGGGRAPGASGWELWPHELGCESGGRDDRVECGQGQLRDGHGPGLRRAEARDHGERVPDLERRKSTPAARFAAETDRHGDDGQNQAREKDNERVWEPFGCARRENEQQERRQRPDPVVQRRIHPAQPEQHPPATRDHKLQPGPELDPFHHRDRDPCRQPPQQARHAQHPDGGADQCAGGEGFVQ